MEEQFKKTNRRDKGKRIGWALRIFQIHIGIRTRSDEQRPGYPRTISGQNSKKPNSSQQRIGTISPNAEWRKWRVSYTERDPVMFLDGPAVYCRPGWCNQQNWLQVQPAVVFGETTDLAQAGSGSRLYSNLPPRPWRWPASNHNTIYAGQVKPLEI